MVNGGRNLFTCVSAGALKHPGEDIKSRTIYVTNVNSLEHFICFFYGNMMKFYLILLLKGRFFPFWDLNLEPPTNPPDPLTTCQVSGA